MNSTKIAEAVANQLVDNNICQVFGIIGSANAHLFDAIYQNPKLSLVCLHHEQACVMAAHGYYMQSGRMAAVIVTAGAGTTNALTGVVGAWADSIPVLIISGQESTKQFKNKNLTRMIGIQGIYTESVYKSCTKSVVTCREPEEIIIEVDRAIKIAQMERGGPCIVDIPIDLQSERLDTKKIKDLLVEQEEKNNGSPSCKKLKETEIECILEAIKESKCPLLWLGNGLRSIAGAELREIVSSLEIPYITSWTATDIFDPIEHLDAGHAGTYGGRLGNLVLQSCDLLITLGTRLAIPQRGYIDDELARNAEIFVVDCDQGELDKLSNRFAYKYCADAAWVIRELAGKQVDRPGAGINEWIKHIRKVKKSLPLIEDCHRDEKWINSYTFMKQLGDMAPKNTTFVTDMGTALISGFQVLRPNSGQRLFTSQGLGEMGYGLPGAIGAWYADQTRCVVCLNCDGGLMMNLQDLHSIISNEIPLKLVIFNNDGYLMIKHTQKAIVEGRKAGTDSASGLTCPDYKKLVEALGFEYLKTDIEDNTSKTVERFIESKKAIVLEVFMDPEQLLVPKLSVSITDEGKLVSPPLEDLSPLISIDQLREFLLTSVSPKSEKIKRDNDKADGDAIY